MRRNEIISVVGAGGKTTYIGEQARILQKQGKRVLITTTTHMCLPEEGCDRQLSQMEDHLKNRGWSVAGRSLLHKGISKMEGLKTEVLQRAVKLADVVLVEADGARGLPFKAPKPWEPVILPGTTKIVVIAGMAAAEAPIRDTCYNSEEICRLLGVKPEHILAQEEMKRLISDTYLKKFKEAGIQVPIEVFFADWTAEKHFIRVCFAKT